jgi:RNA polymerase primary sigma factor
MTDAQSWFQELEALGLSQGFLTYAQVNDRLPLSMVDPEEIERTVERLKKTGIRIVPESPS